MKFSLKEINYTIVNKKNFTTLARKRDWTQSGKKTPLTDDALQAQPHILLFRWANEFLKGAL